MQSVARLGRAAVPVVGGVAGAVASGTSGTAHADAVATHDIPFRRIADDWELADVAQDNKSVVLFTPADIDNAVNMLTRWVAGAAARYLMQESGTW